MRWIHRFRHPGPARRRARGLAALAVAASAVAALTVLSPAPATAGAAARPDLRMPVGCGQTWELKTYRGHNPDDKKIDMYRDGGGTTGTPVLASAPGEVHELFAPGGVEIDHGGGWFTVYLHMTDITVRPGDRLGPGQQIGRAGSVGTHSPHLHYEQLYDTNGDGDGETDEMVHPVIQGVAYRLSPDGPFPHVTSTNNCAGGDPAPEVEFGTWGRGIKIREEPSIRAGVVTTLPGPTRVRVRCQRHAELVEAEGYRNDAWSYLSSHRGWISNIYIDHPAAWLPGVEECRR